MIRSVGVSLFLSPVAGRRLAFYATELSVLVGESDDETCRAKNTIFLPYTAATILFTQLFSTEMLREDVIELSGLHE